ncbi:Pilin accessory protein (PilO) [Roseateles sp. YR242]|uniref:type 4b pilus protein PilO2 n=1 Tax=Roseateles sp. YR242 TaxID=1855305 RepID=UPI0008BAEEFC|nr:type 4b pilus protein PilO2 [Roseateles sp. YR242]SEK64584.1 Pilin accessory protein (PilO) [Roseateles sp. YR242]
MLVITEIRKRRYASGLLWQSLSHPRELRAEAAELARKLNMNLMVLRKDLGLAQAGFASSREGGQPGLLSLGALVAGVIATRGVAVDGTRQPASSWLAALRLDEQRWAYLAVREESFLPSGDFAGTRDEVLDRLHADYALGGWNAVIGDASLAEQGFHNFEAVTLADVLPRHAAPRWWSGISAELRPVQRKSQRALAVACLALVGVAVGGTVWWQQRQATQARLSLDQARLAADERRSRDQKQPRPPWPDKPMPREMARACAQLLEVVAPGGWKLDEYRCFPNQATHQWSRGQSMVSYLLEQRPDAIVDLNGETASRTQAIAASAGLNEELMDSRRLLPPLVGRFQRLGLRLEVKAPSAPGPAAPALPGLKQFTPEPPSWRVFPFSLRAGGLPLAEIASALSQPGVRLEKLLYRDGDWFVEGVAYAK